MYINSPCWMSGDVVFCADINILLLVICLFVISFHISLFLSWHLYVVHASKKEEKRYIYMVAY